MDQLPWAERQEIRAQTPAEMLEEIETRRALGWIPVEINVHITRLVSNTLGADNAYEFYKNLLLNVYQSSMFRTFVESGIRVLGLDLSAALRYIPLAYPMMFKNCGTWKTVQSGDGFAVLDLSGLPPVCGRDPVWIDSVRGSLCSVLIVARLQGDCDLEEFHPSAGRARYRLHWTDGSIVGT